MTGEHRHAAGSRVAIVADATVRWASSVAAGLAERHDVLGLTLVADTWFLGSHPLGPSPATSTAGAVALISTADVVLPLGGDARVGALAQISGLPSSTSTDATRLTQDWWTVRLLAADAGVAVAEGVRVTRRTARGLDYLGPVTVRPAERTPIDLRMDAESPHALSTALERAFTYAEHAVVEETPDGDRVTVALVRRPDGAVVVSAPVRARAQALVDSGIGARTGELPVRGRAGSGSGGRVGARPPHFGSVPAGMTPPAEFDDLDRTRIDRAALDLMTALGAGGVLTASFVVGEREPVLDDVDLAPDLGPSGLAARMLAAGGSDYCDFLDLVVAAAR